MHRLGSVRSGWEGFGVARCDEVWQVWLGEVTYSISLLWRKREQMVLTKIQAQERAKRKRNRLKMRGLLTPPGTPTRRYRPVSGPAWKGPRIGALPDLGGMLTRLNLLLTPWGRRRLKQEPPKKILPKGHQ